MIKVYRYGLLPPRENAALVETQMRAAHRYQNTLTEIERGARAARRAACGAYEVEVARLERAHADADEACAALAREIKAHKANARTRSAPTVLREAFAAAKARRAEAAGALRLARAWLLQDAAVQARLDEIKDLRGQLVRSAREHCGCYWGSYLLVEDAWSKASAMPLYDGTEATDPHFRRWDGEGAVGVHVMMGMPSGAVLGGAGTLLAIDALPDDWTPSGKPRPFAPTPGSRRANRLHMLRMRVSSTEEGRPIWATWPLVYDRELPDGASVKRAKVVRRMHGPKAEWSLHVTVDLPDPAPARRHAGAVAVDLGWRRIGDDEIRVAVWRGEDGGTGEVRLSGRDIGALRKAQDLVEIRRRSFNATMLWFVGLAATEKTPEVAGWITGREVPEWFTERTQYARQWKSAERLYRLLDDWTVRRWDGDAEAFEQLSRWRHDPANKSGDRHLWLWEVHQRTGAQRRRDDLYRRAAAALAERYDTLVLERFDLRDFAQRGELGNEPGENEMARSNRQLAAPSRLREFLRQAFVGRGGRVEKRSGVDSTHTCPECGVVTAFDAAKAIDWICACGRVHDQDESAAHVLLTEHIVDRERARDAQEAGGARGDEDGSNVEEVKESRWVRARRLAAERRARQETARKPADNAAE